MQRKVIRKAMRPSLKIVLNATKVTVPERKQKSAKTGRYSVRGLLKSSLGIRAPKSYPNGTVWAGVGPRGGAKWKKRTSQNRLEVPTQYAHLSEGGTTGIRAQRAQRWYRRAWASSRVQFFSVFKREMTTGFDKFGKKLAVGMPPGAKGLTR